MSATPTSQELTQVMCGYCGEPVPLNSKIFAPIVGKLEPMCCHGCAALQFLTGDGEPGRVVATVEERLAIDGISCGNCVKAIERALLATVGVATARVDPIAQEVELGFDGRLVTLDRLRAILRRLGYPTALPADTDSLREKGRRTALKGVLFSWLFMMQVMMLSGPTYLTNPGDIPADLEQLMRIAQAVLTLPVLIVCTRPIFRAALRDLRFGQIGADLPVTIGIAAAFIASMLSLTRGYGAVYFDSITMFLALLLTSRWLQQRGLNRAASYLHALHQRRHPSAHLIGVSGEITEVSPGALTPGDLVLIRPGEVIVADGTVEEGSGHCSESLLTGESTPIQKHVGSQVLAGAVNIDAVLKLRVQSTGTGTKLSSIGRLAANAARARPSAVTLAEQASPLVVALVLAVTLAAGIYWWHSGATRSVAVMLAVLVITCPCALSLAAPATLAAAQAALAARGILVARLSAIEALAGCNSVVLDKTGTLTSGRMELERVEVLRDGFTPRAVTKLAAALEQASNHPIAQAICRAQPTATEIATALEVTHGAGVRGKLDGRSYRIGTDAYVMAGHALGKHEVAPCGDSSSALLADNQGPLARFHFTDPERGDARDFVKSLRDAHRPVAILSGDLPATVEKLANRLGVCVAYGAMTPVDKRNFVAAMQENGDKVFMVGDGINDAPVIAQADVSAAFASATTLAQTSADFIVLGSQLSDIQAAMRIAGKATRIIRQNLIWAFAYNLVAIPVAATGIVTPLGAALGMSLSSLIVVGNALRLLPRKHS